ncbi:hypothetical protein F5B19DRAFT_468778 [Rostrohypoxylon terebratum]|nr:hypothetical protein F5B19DRAFT_468778 [Rostrohypoxylon terebratum]
MPKLPGSLEDLDDQEQDESSSDYYSPQLESTPTFTLASNTATETAPSTPDLFNLNNTFRRCKCGDVISYDDVTSRAISPSHDISTSGYHIELDEWLGDLTHAIGAAWSKRRVTYSDVHVLMITWEETDMPGMKKEIKRLSSVFSDVFGYNIHGVTIPTSKPDLKVRREVDNFIEDYGQEDNLLIVYYAGHARPGLRSGAPPIWYPRNPTDGQPVPSFDTNNILPILARAQDDSPDVLLIYDCCHSLSSHLTNDKPSRALVECLFAGGFETKVPIAGPDSFTHALYDELFIAGKASTPLSVTDLHRKIIHSLENWKPHGVFNKDGTIKRDKMTKELIITKPVRITPIHMFLSKNNSPRTICLSPLKKQDSDTPDAQHRSLDTERNIDQPELPRVLIAVRLVEKDHNAEALKTFKNWLLDAPHCVVRFEKLYQSYSELLLVELPLQVWDLLPRNAAVTFIGFTKGEKSIDTLKSSADNVPAATASQLVPHEVQVLGEQVVPEAHTPDDSITYLLATTQEDRRLTAVLKAIDQILPETFNDMQNTEDLAMHDPEILFKQVMDDLIRAIDLQEGGKISKEVISQHKNYLFQYISAKHLIRHSPPWLGIENRLTGPLSRIYSWHDDDDRAESNPVSIPEAGTFQTFSDSSTNHSKLWTDPSTVGSSSGIAMSMLDSTPDISIRSDLQKKPLGVEDESTGSMREGDEGIQLETSPNEATVSEENPGIPILGSLFALDHLAYFGPLDMEELLDYGPDSLDSTDDIETPSKGPESEPEYKLQRDRASPSHEQSMKDNPEEETDPITRSPGVFNELVESQEATEAKAKTKVVSFDPQLRYLPEDSDSGSESQHSTLSDSTLTVPGHELDANNESEVDYPTIKSKHATIDDPLETVSVKSYSYPSEKVDVGDPRSFLDSRYRIHKDTDFQPGRVFKTLWPEPRDDKTPGVEGRIRSKFYIGIRRFIIIATDEAGHSTCVPILTYGRRGCTKAGVNPKTHGIIYSVSDGTKEREPRLLKGEPELGFPSVKIDGYLDDDPLPKESRVNYAKFITIEHNTKIFFIGFISFLDFKKVVRATNECWEKNMRKER